MTATRPTFRTLTAATALLLTLAAPLAQAQAASAPAAAAAARFTVSADGQEVTDTTTNLVWRRCVEGQSFDGTTCKGKATGFKFAGAKEAAASAAKAAGKAWRVPSKDELAALVIKGKKKPFIDAAAFPAAPAAPTWASRPGFDDNLNAFLVNFKNGHVDGNSGAGKFALRLVRAAG